MANIKISELTALTPPDAADLVPVTDSSASQTKRTTVGEIVGIVNGDVDVADDGTATISELPVSKLQDGSARQLLQTDAAGTGVEWTSNVDVPGTLDVTGATTLDSTLGVTGQSTLASAAVSDLTSGRVVLAGTSGELEDNAGLTFNGTQLDVDGDVVITGDLTVEGASTVLETQTVTVEDKNIELGVVASPTDVTADGGGITLKGTTDKTINWVDATDAWTSSERFSVPLGSDAAPSLTFTGDPDTGIYSPGADQLALSTNGRQRIAIDSSGAITIGEENVTNAVLNAPESVFVNIDSNADDTTEAFVIAANRTGTSGGNELLRVTEAGLVGIGTSAPVSQLDIAGNPARATIRSTKSGNFAFSEEYGTLYFYSNDVSGGGAGNIAGIRAVHHSNYSQANQSGEVDGTASAGLAFFTGTSSTISEKVRITDQGRVGIGTTSPADTIHVQGSDVGLRITNTNSAATSKVVFGNDLGTPAQIFLNGSTKSNFGGNGALTIYHGEAKPILFATSDAERCRIDASGRLLVGTSTAPPISNGQRIYVSGTGSSDSGIQCVRWNASFGGYALGIGRSRSGTPGTYSIVSNNDDLGSITWYGDDGTDLNTPAASINAYVDGTPGANDMPGRLVFSTTADGASSPTERMRIDSSGRILIGTSSNSGDALLQVAGSSVRYANRQRATVENIYQSGAGRVFTVTGGSNGKDAHLFFEAFNHNGYVRKRYQFLRSVTGWTAVEHESDVTGTAPTVTVAGSGTATLTVTVVGAGANPNFYSQGVIEYEHSTSYISFA